MKEEAAVEKMEGDKDGQGKVQEISSQQGTPELTEEYFYASAFCPPFQYFLVTFSDRSPLSIDAPEFVQRMYI